MIMVAIIDKGNTEVTSTNSRPLLLFPVDAARATIAIVRLSTPVELSTDVPVRASGPH